jgi:hypothetical protein
LPSSPRNERSVIAAGAFSRWSIVVTSPSGVRMSMKPPPPMPAENCSVDAEHAAAATAASHARCQPRRRTPTGRVRPRTDRPSASGAVPCPARSADWPPVRRACQPLPPQQRHGDAQAGRRPVRSRACCAGPFPPTRPGRHRAGDKPFTRLPDYGGGPALDCRTPRIKPRHDRHEVRRTSVGRRRPASSAPPPGSSASASRGTASSPSSPPAGTRRTA